MDAEDETYWDRIAGLTGEDVIDRLIQDRVDDQLAGDDDADSKYYSPGIEQPPLDEPAIEYVAGAKDEKGADVGKELEALVIKKSYFFADNIRALDIVKKFIKRKNRIIYGGTAIDFALRAKGSNLYPDEFLNFPDLDFYSPTSVQDAYELANELFEAGIENVSAIVAYHTQTMRVRFNTIPVADISYMPENIFASLKYIEYDGYRIVHPHHQFVDMHNGMSAPFDNAPREVILDRKNKDCDRFNMLYKFYPIAEPRIELTRMTVRPDSRKVPTNAMLIGLPAYAVYYEMGIQMKLDMSHYPYAHLKDDYELELDWAAPTPHITYFIDGSEYIKPTRAAYMDADRFPPSIETSDSQIFISEHQRHHISKYGKFIVTSAQRSLAFLLFQHEQTENKAYLIYYLALLRLVNAATEYLIKNPRVVKLSPFIIPLQFWPSEDVKPISPALDIALKTCLLAIDQYDGEPIVKPQAFYPSNSGRTPPQFDYKSSKYFQIDYLPIV